jgi:hypothetical protein
MIRPTVGEVISGYRSYDYILKSQLLYSVKKSIGFLLIKTFRFAFGHITKTTPTRTYLSKYHKGSRPRTKALGNIGATGLFTHGIELEISE